MKDLSIDGALQFFAAHEGWLALAAFLLAFVKSLPLVPVFIPGTTLLLAIGGLIGASQVALLPVWIAISVGAACGDWVSYALGTRFADRIVHSRVAARYPGMLPRGIAFFQRWGAPSIFVCRFFGPLRATVPLAAGICGMPALSFQLANWASAFLWSAALLLPGAVLANLFA